MFPFEVLASVPLLALPCPSVLVSWVVGLHLLEAILTHKDPFPRFVDANTIENITVLLATITGFGANAFDGHFTESSDLGSGNVRPQNLARRRASSSYRSFLLSIA